MQEYATRCVSPGGKIWPQRAAASLAPNTSLTFLNLYGNRGIGEQGKQLLRDAVAGRQWFRLVI